MDWEINVVLLGPWRPELDTDIERIGGAIHIGPVQKIDDAVGIDLGSGDPIGSVRSSYLQSGELGLVEMEEQAAQIVAYLRSVAASKPTATTGDVTRGKAIFEGKGGCLNCHRVGDRGSYLGPDLTEIGVDVRALIKDVAEIKGKISQMPTAFQMQAWFVGVAIGLVALVFAVARALK